MVMNQKNWQKFPVLFSLYIAQSIPMSFFSTVVPVIMRQEHYSLQSIGLLQLVKLPWIIKFLWAPVVDNGTRSLRDLRRWIIGSELFYAAVILFIGCFSLQADFKLVVLLMLFAFVASATQDIAVDIYAILMLKPSERGLGNSMQSAGSFVGSVFGTGILLIAYHYLGWSVLMVLLAAFVAFAIFPMIFYRKPLPSHEVRAVRVSFLDIFRFFKQKGNGRWALVLVFYYSGFIGILTMLKPYLVDLGYNVKQIGFMSGIFGTSVAAICALCAAWIVKRIGRQAAIFSFLAVSLCASSFFWWMSLGVPSLMVVYLAIALLWGGYGLSTVIIYTISMDRVRCGYEGTDFTLQIVITHLSSLIFAVLSGQLAGKLGYSGLFAIEAVLSVVTGFILFVSSRKLKSNANS
jgi:MFS family permease